MKVGSEIERISSNLPLQRLSQDGHVLTRKGGRTNLVKKLALSLLGLTFYIFSLPLTIGAMIGRDKLESYASGNATSSHYFTGEYGFVNNTRSPCAINGWADHMKGYDLVANAISVNILWELFASTIDVKFGRPLFLAWAAGNLVVVSGLVFFYFYFISLGKVRIVVCILFTIPFTFLRFLVNSCVKRLILRKRVTVNSCFKAIRKAIFNTAVAALPFCCAVAYIVLVEMDMGIMWSILIIGAIYPLAIMAVKLLAISFALNLLPNSALGEYLAGTIHCKLLVSVEVFHWLTLLSSSEVVLVILSHSPQMYVVLSRSSLKEMTLSFSLNIIIDSCNVLFTIMSETNPLFVSARVFAVGSIGLSSDSQTKANQIQVYRRLTTRLANEQLAGRIAFIYGMSACFLMHRLQVSHLMISLGFELFKQLSRILILYIYRIRVQKIRFGIFGHHALCAIALHPLCLIVIIYGASLNCYFHY